LELVKANEEALELERQVLGRAAEEADAAAEVQEEPRPPLFTKMKDPAGYNARLLSVARIKSILMTDFIARKKLMQSKMMSQPSKMVKLDFTYKIPGKVNVYKGVGDCFKPYRCMFVLQNEKNQTVYWKCLSSSESIESVKKGLLLFQKLNPETVLVIWCDNCCNIREKLKETFPDAIVLLDIFHWDKRWDVLLYDTKSEEASIFRGLIKHATFRATFHVPTSEYEEAKARVKKKLQKQKKLPIGEDCRSVVPDPPSLRQSVMAVLRYCMMCDTGIEIRKLNRNPDDTSELPKPFFKPMNADCRWAMANQLLHIDKGCLSDPVGFSLHHKNPESSNVTCCRGTKNDNLYLDQLTGKTVGITKADRLITSFFELGNDRKMVLRLGRQKDWSDIFTSCTEELALINSMCVLVGFKEDELPFKVSNPPELDDKLVPELGFDVSVPVSSGEVTGDVLATAQLTMADGAVERSDADYDEDGTDELEPVAGVPPTNENQNTEEAASTEDDLELAEFLEEIDLAGEPLESTQRKVIALSTEIFKPETTMESFIRLTNQQEWVPFNHS